MADLNPKPIIEALIDQVWRPRRWDRLPLFWTADCLNHADPAAHKQGLDALRRYHESFDAWFSDFDDLRIDIVQQIAEGDTVASRIRLEAKHRPTARPVGFETIRVDRMVEGKIAEHWSIADLAGLQSQLA